MINKIDIKYSKNHYIVWLNGTIFLSQPVYYTSKIPTNITPQAYWYVHVLHVLQQHGLLTFYINKKNKI